MDVVIATLNNSFLLLVPCSFLFLWRFVEEVTNCRSFCGFSLPSIWWWCGALFYNSYRFGQQCFFSEWECDFLMFCNHKTYFYRCPICHRFCQVLLILKRMFIPSENLNNIGYFCFYYIQQFHGCICPFQYLFVWCVSLRFKCLYNVFRFQV